MQTFAETERLILREIVPSDDKDMFELNSDKDVVRFLGRPPFEHIDEARKEIEMIRQQYIGNGIGRWAVIEKGSNNFLGWSGLKVVKEERNGHTNFYDLGYRLKSKYWGKGFATESAKAALAYGFTQLNQNEIYGMTHINNLASKRVLEKTGLKCLGTFDLSGMPHYWFELSKTEWLKVAK